MKKTEKYLQQNLVHTTQEGVRIYVGSSLDSSEILYRATRGEVRKFTELDIVVELYVKSAANMQLTLRLRDEILKAFEASRGSAQRGPTLTQNEIEPFQPLNEVGEFSVELLYVAAVRLLMRERARRSRRPLYRVLIAFGVKDRYTVIEHAVAEQQRAQQMTTSDLIKPVSKKKGV